MQACDCRGRLVASSADLVVTPSALDFGTVTMGTVVIRDVSAKNAGKVPIAIDAVRLDGDRAFSTGAKPVTLEPGQTVLLPVVYLAPAQGGSATGSLTLVSGKNEVRVTLDAFSLALCEAPQTCGTQCGVVADGCGGMLSCGACADAGSCVALTCGARCGAVSNGCGAMLDCGGCGDAGTCVALTCQTAGAACGTTLDGCGGTLSCGGCTNGSACQANQCLCAAGTTESCSDGVDNNCDGNVDCVDPQCSALAACAQQPCTVTDPEPQVTNSSNGNWGPAIFWTGTGYGVFFLESTFRYGFARLDASLATLTAPTLVTGSTTAHRPFPAWTGTTFGIGWSDTRAGALQFSNEVYFNRFSATSGLAMSGTDVGISTGPGLAFPSATGWNAAANEYGVLFADEGPVSSGGNQRRVYFQRVDATGQLVGTKQKVSPAALTDGTGDYGHLVWGGSSWGAAWTEIRNGVGPHIYFSRLTAAGAPEPTDTQVSAGSTYGMMPRVASSGTAFGVVYTDSRAMPQVSNVYFQRFDSATTGAATPRAVTTSGKVGLVDVIWAGTHWAVVFSDSRGGYQRLYYAKLDLDGNKVGAEQLISCAAKPAVQPSLAFDGTKLTVAFSYQTGSAAQIHVKRFTP